MSDWIIRVSSAKWAGQRMIVCEQLISMESSFDHARLSIRWQRLSNDYRRHPPWKEIYLDWFFSFNSKWSMIVIDRSNDHSHQCLSYISVFLQTRCSTAGGQWWHSTTIELIFLLIRMWTLMMMLMMTISIIHLYWTFIADMHIFCMFLFLLILSGWVVTVGVRAYVWNFLHGATDFFYAWLHLRSIYSSIIFRSFSLLKFSFSKAWSRISGFIQRVWILHIELCKQKQKQVKVNA